jgi:hypothetical protein
MRALSAIECVKKPRLAFHPGLAVSTVFLTGLALITMIPGLLHFPCPWKLFFGIPCPTCGAGRCVRALLELRLLEAFLLNPLFFAALLIGAIYASLWLIQLLFGYKLQASLQHRHIHILRRMLVLSIVLNYAYLLYFRI